MKKKGFLIYMSNKMKQAIDQLVAEGFYESRNEFIREITRKYLLDNNLIEFNVVTEVE